MEKKFLLCPQCDSQTFYAEDPDGKNVFFSVDDKKNIVPTQETNTDLSNQDFSNIHCTGCAWYGSIDELKTGEK